MNAKIQRRLRAAKRRIAQRLDKSQLGDCSQPVLAGRNIHYELAERAHGLAYGGLGAVVLLVRQLGLAEAIDRQLHLLKIHLPYHESDHVLNLAYNALCDGTCLDDIELRRNDEVFLDALGAGFRRVLLRGDTDFTQTKHLDRWDDDPRVRFTRGSRLLGQRPLRSRERHRAAQRGRAGLARAGGPQRSRSPAAPARRVARTLESLTLDDTDNPNGSYRSPRTGPSPCAPMDDAR